MRNLKSLVRILQRSLHAMLFRRLVAWASCALLLLVLGNILSHVLGDGRVLRLGVFMAGLSFLPVFLLWPPAEKRLTDRLRSVDDEMVFEALLEAEPGPVRDILQRLAAERAFALPFLEIPREPLLAGLGGLYGTAIALFLLVEAISFAALGRSLALSPERPAATGGGERIEERGFSEFATEDPAARRTRREQAQQGEEKGVNQGVNPALGMPGESVPQAAGRGSRTTTGASAANKPPASEAVAKRKQGERDEDSVGAEASANATSSAGGQKTAEPGANPPGTRMVPTGTPGQARGGAPPMPSATGQGYEHTGDTKVPSPLLDYRSQFESRYAERTGRYITANGRMGFGELRDYQRRYFESFTLRADVGAAEDPYAALLKRRWAALKEGN